ncbi:polysaccharide biosynthesis tyrosine autokinase [Rhizobium sp. BE258]|uniref:polysaccharide biosynthesis tyrosine autokinase n=1 Tax=Rhizobium sp. BE258 TaxID=2817722 RepID=UPI0028593C1A|nr:polysaccharide biosynthesis tyrosine autokinase [Rhizobium sp. BE258]MDR7145214.1 succinoglycan biosynthesis transport protein ExoP [Rhizobium sp. BE258]
MLNQSKLQVGNDFDDGDQPASMFSNPLSGFDLIGAARRQFWIVVASVVVMGIVGMAYIAQAIPTYTSSSSVLIDAKNVGMTAASPLEGSLTFETGAVDSQLQILTSDKLAETVATRLGLQNNMAFLDPEGSPVFEAIGAVKSGVGKIAQIFDSSPASPELKDLPENFRLLIASQVLQNNLKVQRVGRTYVFELSYTDRDPMLAQSIVGQFTNAYLEDQLDSKFDSTRRATNWMEERIRDLKARSLAADEAVQKYRADNNLIAASGRLIDEQSLTDATTQLTAARSVLDTASARYQRLKQIIDSQDVNGRLTEASENPNVAQLRTLYLQASKTNSDLSAKYGADHQAAVKARKDMAEYKRLIFEEWQNVLPGYESEVSIAQAQVNSIQNSIAQLTKTSATNDSASVKLRSLEQEAETLKTLYSTFLQKSQELQQQQSFPVTDARIISDPSTPLSPSSPRKFLILVASLMLGGAIGGSIGLLREWRDRGFRTGAQVRDELGLEFVTNVPLLDASQTQRARLGHMPDGRAVGGRKSVAKGNPILRKVVDDPFSQYAEAIRAIRSRIAFEFPNRKGIVIGMASVFPDEGKSTIAKNLASSLALQGTKTILLDGDFRNPSLTKDLAGNPRVGLLEVSKDPSVMAEAISFEDESGLAFLPSAQHMAATNDFFGSSSAHDLIEVLRRHFDVVIIDFPPVGALTDALSASTIVDGYLFVTHWGKTPRSVLREFVSNQRQVAAKTLGVILNCVDVKKLNRYGGHQPSAQYAKYQEKYFSGPGSNVEKFSRAASE